MVESVEAEERGGIRVERGGGVAPGMVVVSLQSLRASARREHVWRPQLVAGVMLTLSFAALPRAAAAVAGLLPRRLSPAQMGDLHGLAAKLIQRNPALAAGIANGIVSIDTRSIRSVDALGDALLSVSPSLASIILSLARALSVSCLCLGLCLCLCLASSSRSCSVLVPPRALSVSKYTHM